MEDFNRTVAYTDQDGRIKLFTVTATEFAASSIWEIRSSDPLVLTDSAGIVCDVWDKFGLLF